MSQSLPLRRRIFAVISVSAGSVLYTLDSSIANVALPTIANALHIAAPNAVLLISGYNLVLAMTLLPLAALGEHWGHRKLFTLGLWLYLLATSLCHFAGGLPLLLLARAAQALAAAAILSVSLAMVRAIYPATHLGRGLSLNTVAASSGAAIAPLVGGAILSLASWTWVFTAGGPIAILALAFSRFLPDPEPRDRPFDIGGAALCALTFGVLIAGFQRLAEGRDPTLTVVILLGGIVFAIIFVRHELKVDLPVLPVDLLKRPEIGFSVAAAFIAVLASTTLLLYIPFRLNALGVAPAMIGGMLAPYALSVIVFGPTSGILSDWLSPSVLGTTGLAIAVVAAALLAGVPSHPRYFEMAWRVALCGAGFSLFFSPNGRLVLGSAPHTRAAAASSLISTSRMFGQALGSTLLGGLLALRLAPSAPALVGAGLAGLALLFSATRIMLPKRLG
jgi:DHA2 family multidrug resistance protein-like MFS transporter